MNEPTKNIVRKIIPRPVRAWLRSPSRSGRWIWDSLSLRQPMIEVLPGYCFKCDPHMIETMKFMGDFDQRQELSQFAESCSPTMRLFDIGAHFGIFSLVAASKGASVVAVEPSSLALPVLRSQMRLNPCGSRVTVLPYAASDTESNIGMLANGPFGGGYFMVDESREAGELESVHATTVDNIAQQFGSPTHLKIDVEGYELNVLKGAERTLQETRPVIFLELHNELMRSLKRDPRAVLDFLSAHGYRNFTDGVKTLLSKPIVRFVSYFAP